MGALEPVVNAFLGGERNFEVGDDLPAERIVAAAREVRGLIPIAESILKQCEGNADSPLWQASAIEFVLEALHVNDKLSKFTYRDRVFYKK